MFQRNDGYLTRPKEISEALRRLADDIDTMTAVELPTMAVSLRVQVCSWVGTASDAERRTAVDSLSTLLLGVPGEPKQMNDGTWHHGAPYKHGEARGDGVNVDIFTALRGEDGEQ